MAKAQKDELSRAVKAKVDVSYSRKACEWMFLIQEKRVSWDRKNALVEMEINRKRYSGNGNDD